MKKIIYVMVITLVMTLFVGTIVNANTNTDIPEYDSSFDNGKGIFYANGTSITIKQDNTGNTVVFWNGGQQIVPDTVRIIGGGKEGSNFIQSNVTMESGTVSHIYGGGASLDDLNISVVEKSNITINGGVVLQSVYGGGLLFTTTPESNITVNGGNIKSICGGGSAAASISGTTYAAGTVDNLQGSKNRVQIANILINDGKITSSIFGGGQGYSYVENTNITVNSGDLSTAYLVAGGSNGYTKNANIRISGGNINVFQTVNRGEMQKATLKIDGGNLTTAYIGGENDSSVTGTINNVDFAILNGNVTNLFPGISNGNLILVNQNEYKAVIVTGTVENSQLSEKEIKIKYTFNLLDDTLKVEKNKNSKPQTQVTTIPSGYEYLFESERINWVSSDTNIVIVDENGTVTGLSKGKGIITATLLEQQDTIEIEVIDTLEIILIIVLIGIVITLAWYYIK